MEVLGDTRGDHHTVTAANIVIATGTRPARPPEVEFDDAHVLDSDGVLKLDRVPTTMVVVGAGVIGIADNVHYNQGDPPGPHQREDGIWQDGAVLIQAADGSLTVWQVKFNTQSLHTDDNGLPV